MTVGGEYAVLAPLLWVFALAMSGYALLNVLLFNDVGGGGQPWSAPRCRYSGQHGGFDVFHDSVWQLVTVNADLGCDPALDPRGDRRPSLFRALRTSAHGREELRANRTGDALPGRPESPGQIGLPRRAQGKETRTPLSDRPRPSEAGPGDATSVKLDVPRGTSNGRADRDEAGRNVHRRRPCGRADSTTSSRRSTPSRNRG